MSYPINTTRPNRFILSASTAALFAISIMLPAQAVNAHEMPKTDSKTMSAQPMAQSKMAGMNGMKHTEGMSMTGDVDYDFAVNMRTHHQMAVDMSQVQLKKGKSPKLRSLAINIIAAQKKEIAVLDQWIKSAKKPIPESK